MAFGDYAVLIDDFNRSNETPLSGGGSWSNKIVAANNNINLGSNQVNSPNGTLGSAWYNASQPGADCEVYATLAIAPTSGSTNARVYARIATPGTGGVDAYFMQYTGSGSWGVFRLTNASASSIVGGSVSLGTGDKIGLQCVGSTLSGYAYSGGSWSLLGSTTDATYSAAGYCGLAVNGGTGGGQLDDFYFGTVSAPAATWTPRAILL
jgi:hypothetical protein